MTAEAIEFSVRAFLIGVGATAFMDLWALFQKRAFGIPALNYAMVGRWIGHLGSGTFCHQAIGAARPIPGERAIGWAAHYAIGVLFAGILIAMAGLGWARQPSFLPALAMGIITVLAPFLILQPGMGAGIAAAKTPAPNTARLRSLIAHTSFGVGLYLAALGANWLTGG